MNKKILIIGSGANVYALAQILSKKNKIFVTSNSDALNEFAEFIDIRENSVNELLEFALENQIDMTVVVSELAIKSDIATIFNKNNQYIFSPTSSAASLLLDKYKAKKVLYKLRIPTPKFGIFEKENMAHEYIKNQKPPFVIKTNDKNSAAILTSTTTAKKILNTSFNVKNSRILIEDYIYGTPFSYYAITDGYKALPFGNALIYRHSLDGNGGQLTNGMGACSPNYRLSNEQEYFLMDNVVYPILEYLEAEGTPYLGILGVDGILSDDGEIFVLGWQSFLQECDATAILNNVDEDLYYLFESCIIGSFSDELEFVKIKDQYSATLVLSCMNRNNKENIINGLENINDNTIISFYPNTSKNKYLEYEAVYGNVLSVTTSASSAAKASKIMYEEAVDINFNGIKYRKDICTIHT